MLFYEPLFLFVFFPSFYLLYLLGERRYWLRGGIILLGSFAFYEWSDPLFPLLVLGSAAIDWVIAGRMDRMERGSRSAKLLLALGVVLNLALLVHFKYTHFFLDNLNVVAVGLFRRGATEPADRPARRRLLRRF